MLFHIKGFKTLSATGLDCPEKLYSIGVLDGKGQQELKLKDEILDKFIFCQVERESTGYRIALEKRLTESVLRSRMRRVGEITGFDQVDQVTRPYLLRYAAAKEFNSSGEYPSPCEVVCWLNRRIEEVTDALQNVILQHSDISTFVRHYEVDVDVDVQGIIRKTGSQTPFVRFACSLSASIDPDRPYKLSPEESKSLNELPVVCARQDTVNKRKRKWEDRKAKLSRAMEACQAAFSHLGDEAPSKVHRQLQRKLEIVQDQTIEAKRRYNKAVCELRNEKQRQRNRRIRENLERYRNEQPVIDLERQLAGKLVDTKVMGALEHKGSMSSQHLMVVDTMLTVPGATLEAEYQRRIDAINAGTAFCSVEEGRPTPRATQSRRLSASDDDESCRPAKRQRHSVIDETDTVLHQAMESVRVRSAEEQRNGLKRPKVTRPTKCFLCIGNSNLPLKDRLKDYATPGSLTRHFKRVHVNPPWPAKGVECNVCGKELLQQKSDLVEHAEAAHGTVVRGRAQEVLAWEYLHQAGLGSHGP
jgi:hypothetical protein